MKYQIIFNPTAGNKKSQKSLSVLESVFKERGVSYAVHTTAEARDAEIIARRLSEQGEREFIVVGGDGTLHETLNGLVDPSVCTIGLIPSGTGNDFADRMEIPLKTEDAVLRILKGESRTVDYMEVSGTRCMNVAGLGIDVDVLERCQRGRLRGKLKYLMSLIKSLFAFKGCKLHFESAEKEETHEALICAVCNGSKFGGGIKICPIADPTDGKLDVIVVDQIGGKWKIVKAFIQLIEGKVIEYPLTTHFKTERIRVETEKPAPIQLDGELYIQHEFDVKICRGLRIY